MTACKLATLQTNCKLTSTSWEDRRRLPGGEFDAVVDHLYELGITTQSKTTGASSLAKDVLKISLDPFTWDVLSTFDDNLRDVVLRETHRSSQIRLLSPRVEDLNPPGPVSPGDIRLPATDPQLHWASEQVFYRCPVITPYDSEIFICVENGDISGMRTLLQLGHASINAVDPYGLGLLYVRCHRSLLGALVNQP